MRYARYAVDDTFGFFGKDGFRIDSACSPDTPCGTNGCDCVSAASLINGAIVHNGSNITWYSDVDLAYPSSGYVICGLPSWTAVNDDSACPLPSIIRTRVPFRYNLSVADADEAVDRNATGFADNVNGNLTVNVVYRFHPPADSDTPAGWARFISNSYGTVSYRLFFSGTGAALASQDVLINTQTGFIQAVPSQPYTSLVTIIATDSAGDSVTLQTWNFTSYFADTVNPANGPGGQDCVHGIRVDGTRCV